MDYIFAGLEVSPFGRAGKGLVLADDFVKHGDDAIEHSNKVIDLVFNPQTGRYEFPTSSSFSLSSGIGDAAAPLRIDPGPPNSNMSPNLSLPITSEKLAPNVEQKTHSHTYRE
ncbi:hypothetical protein [Acanthopleuribacter pedis]|uniref:Uncharacterized protein n=1 Tax=Acanthopleuribacter pedis TaxID=442870 RepID=A0A8J7U6A2_9BACT|nr:hypothetical protein [Acanthopleuribacter pedis]MBO1321704.1 hypothetical protein [Acanthopleuribacter pedis]